MLDRLTTVLWFWFGTLHGRFESAADADASSTVTRFNDDGRLPNGDVTNNESVDDERGMPPETGRHYFRYLSVDSADPSRLYVGSVNHVYVVRASNISAAHSTIKSPDLTRLPGISDAIQSNFYNCLARGKDSLFSCQNHVRAVIPMDGKLFVCTTGSDSPIVYYLDPDSLKVQSFDLKGGRAKCPYDPSSNYTIVYVENGNPSDIPSLYSATVTDFTGSDPVIYRPPLDVARYRGPWTGSATSTDPPRATESANRKHSDVRASTGRGSSPTGLPVDYRLLRTEQDLRWLNDPQFVGSFDVGDYVYFFFREMSLEHASCGRHMYSRIARVCKTDEGGSSLSMDYRWTTFLKARLNCSLNNGGDGNEIPFYFDEIYDVRYNETERMFYGLFRTVHSGYWGTAVCSFSLESIDRVFDRGPFNAQQATFGAGWQKVPDDEVPSPRPGQCGHHSQDISTSTLAFIKSHPLMFNTIDSSEGRPLFFTKDDIAATRLAVTKLGKYTIFFIASSRGSVHKIAQWKDTAGRVQSLIVAILRPFQQTISNIWQMILHTTENGQSYLYLATDEAVLQVSVDDCALRYTTCTSCARDPHCGWDVELGKCRPYQPNVRLIRKVTTSTSVDEVCSRHCTKSTKIVERVAKIEVLSGAPLHLDCALPTGRHGGGAGGGCNSVDNRVGLDHVQWRFAASRTSTYNSQYQLSEQPGSTDYRTLDTESPGSEFILTRDGGLITLGARLEQSGSYTCSIGGATVVRHDVTVLPCSLPMERNSDNNWKREFVRWCSAFNAFTREYNRWLCLKKRCIEEKCIPQSVIDSCSP